MNPTARTKRNSITEPLVLDQKKIKLNPEEIRKENEKIIEVRREYFKNADAHIQIDLSNVTFAILGKKIRISFNTASPNFYRTWKIIEIMVRNKVIITKSQEILNELGLENSLTEKKNSDELSIKISGIVLKNFELTLQCSILEKNLALSYQLAPKVLGKDFNKDVLALKALKVYHEHFKILTDSDQYLTFEDGSNNVEEISVASFLKKLFKKGRENRYFKIGTCRFFTTKNLQDLFLIQEEIGCGADATVYKVFDVLKKDLKALRRTNKRLESDEEEHQKAMDGMKNGVSILEKLNLASPNKEIKGIPKCLGKRTIFYTKNSEIPKGFTITELAYGDLFNYAMEQQLFTLTKKRIWLGHLADLFEALEFTHENGIVHGDIKPENVLVYLDEKSQVSKLLISDWDGASSNGTQPNKGTAMYQTREKDKDAKDGDVFALSKTVGESVCGRPLSLEAEDQERFYARPWNLSAEETKIQIIEMWNNAKVYQGIIDTLTYGLSTPIPTIKDLRERFEKARKK